MTAATERPWVYFSGGHGIYGGPGGGTCVAITMGPRGNSDRQNANAELILRAVRVLDALAKFSDLPDEIVAMMEPPDA
jgi:hypothetical protein